MAVAGAVVADAVVNLERLNLFLSQLSLGWLMEARAHHNIFYG